MFRRWCKLEPMCPKYIQAWWNGVWTGCHGGHVHFPFFKTQQEWWKCFKCSCNGVVYKQQQGGASVRRDVRSHLISARQPAGALCAMHCYEWKGPRHGGKVDFDRSPVEFINLENDNIGKQRLRLPFLKTTISSRNKDPSLFIYRFLKCESHRW